MYASPTNTLRSWTKDGSTSSAVAFLLIRTTPLKNANTEIRFFHDCHCCVSLYFYNMRVCVHRYLEVYWDRHTLGQTSNFLHLQHYWMCNDASQMVCQLILWPASNEAQRWWCPQWWHCVSGTKLPGWDIEIKQEGCFDCLSCHSNTTHVQLFPDVNKGTFIFYDLIMPAVKWLRSTVNLVFLLELLHRTKLHQTHVDQFLKVLVKWKDVLAKIKNPKVLQLGLKETVTAVVTDRAGKKESHRL